MRLEASAITLRPPPSSVGGDQLPPRLSDQLELTDRFLAKQQRHTGPSRHHHGDRAEEDRRRTGVRFKKERCQHAGEDPPARLAEKVPAAAVSTSNETNRAAALHGYRRLQAIPAHLSLLRRNRIMMGLRTED